MAEYDRRSLVAPATLTRRLQDRPALSAPGGTRVIQAGPVVGTPAYLSPERTTGGVTDRDQRPDLYALGCVLFQTSQRRRLAKDRKDRVATPSD